MGGDGGPVGAGRRGVGTHTTGDDVARIRAATIGDADRVAALQARAWQVAYRGLVPDDELDAIDPAEWAARWRQGFGQPPREGVHTLVSTGEDDHAVAVAGFGPAREPYDDVTGELYILYADPDVWGQGHGSALLREVHDRLAADGHARALLWMMAGNERTRAIYEHHGWVADGASKREEMSGITVEEIRLVRDLTAQ